MNRHALLSVGLLITGIAAAMPGCGEETSNGNNNKPADAGAAGQGLGGEHAGGSGVKPSAGEGGAPQPHAGAGGAAEGGMPSAGAGAGGVATGGVAMGGAGGEGGAFSSCDLRKAFGNLGPVDGIADEFGDASPGAGWLGPLPGKSDYTTDLRVDLYDGFGPFDPERKLLTNFTLEGDDLDYATCGVCVYILQRQGLDEKKYFVTGGQVTLTSVKGRVTGSASNLTFEEVEIDDEGHSVPVPDGCTSRITGVSFDEPTGDGGAGGGANN